MRLALRFKSIFNDEFISLESDSIKSAWMQNMEVFSELVVLVVVLVLYHIDTDLPNLFNLVVNGHLLFFLSARVFATLTVHFYTQASFTCNDHAEPPTNITSFTFCF